MSKEKIGGKHDMLVIAYERASDHIEDEVQTIDNGHLRAGLDVKLPLDQMVTKYAQATKTAIQQRGKAVAKSDQEEVKGKPVERLLTEKIVEMNYKRIVTVTADIAFMHRLTELILMGNELACLPSAIGLLGNLQILSLGRNKLRELPDCFAKMDKLVELRLEGNKLKRLPVSMSKMISLRELDISGNCFKELPRFLANISSLTVLDACRNKIECIPAELLQVRNLRRILLDGNPLLLRDSDLSKRMNQKTHSQNKLLTLQELAGQRLICDDVSIKIKSIMPFRIEELLASTERCCHCYGPIFRERWHYEGRIVRRHERDLPVEYRMCQPHWTHEVSRIRSMFTVLPSTPESIIALLRHRDRPVYH